MKISTRHLPRHSASLYPLRIHHHHPKAPQLPLYQTHQNRPFSDLLNPSQTLTATRILPYRAPALYNLIADISSYSSFIPYCTSSHITSQSDPDPVAQKRWPRTAELRVGYGPYNELFRSSVYCIPYRTIEAVAGEAKTTIPQEALGHYPLSQTPRPHSQNQQEKNEPESTLISSLLTRWTLHEFPFKPSPPDGQSPQEGNANANPAIPRTEVRLVIEVKFASAVYSALSQAVAPTVAGLMIEAFEKRAGEVLGSGEHGAAVSGGERKM